MAEVHRRKVFLSLFLAMSPQEMKTSRGEEAELRTLPLVKTFLDVFLKTCGISPTRTSGSKLICTAAAHRYYVDPATIESSINSFGHLQYVTIGDSTILGLAEILSRGSGVSHRGVVEYGRAVAIAA
ncbi:hypothetical protein Tco_0801013 [Tanacetum coccineum]|uniref:Uncharacterized protein n=1 Tax=Tanacetum coccineum TaxID=301880 RepID=A0ABQ4ZYN2_9ASTR